jgi:hypothetical protein
MAYFVKSSASSHPGGPLDSREWFTLTPGPDRDDPPVHPIVWIVLADDALSAGGRGGGRLPDRVPGQFALNKCRACHQLAHLGLWAPRPHRVGPVSPDYHTQPSIGGV